MVLVIPAFICTRKVEVNFILDLQLIAVCLHKKSFVVDSSFAF